MDSHTLTDHDCLQIRNLMIVGFTEQDATRAYLHHQKDTTKAADRLHFLKICNHNFCDHALKLMKADLLDIEKVFTIADQLGILSDSLHAHRFVELVNQLIHEDHCAVNK